VVYRVVMRRRVALAVGLLALGVIASAGARPSTSLTPVVSGLSQPVHVTQAPGDRGRLYVVEQGGVIRVVEQGRVRAQPFLDVRSLIVSGGEQGLLGLAFAPDYQRSGFFVVNYTNRAGHTRVVRYRAADGRVVPSSARTLLAVDQPYPNHNGGGVAFGPDGLLYVGLGDGGSGGDPENRSQSMQSRLGKLITLDIRKSESVRIVALGLRNPWRYSFDRGTGDLWIGDVGQNAIEEIDRLPRGTTGLVNFGWDVYEGASSFEDKALGPGRLVQPVVQYSHDEGCSVTGGFVYRGPGVPALKGRYVYGDYCSGRIWSIPSSSARPTARLEGVRVPNLVSFGEDLDGRLYAVSHGGVVYRFT
jgi:glucose/arabinose dehydrogenase